jgi:hypothetical protein
LKHEDRLPFDKIPLTVGKARRDLVRLYEERREKGGEKKYRNAGMGE